MLVATIAGPGVLGAYALFRAVDVVISLFIDFGTDETSIKRIAEGKSQGGVSGGPDRDEDCLARSDRDRRPPLSSLGGALHRRSDHGTASARDLVSGTVRGVDLPSWLATVTVHALQTFFK